MNPDWTPEQKSLYRQLVGIIFGNLPIDTPTAAALQIAKLRAAAVIEDPELFPES